MKIISFLNQVFAKTHSFNESVCITLLKIISNVSLVALNK